MRKIKINIEGMTCTSCAANIEKSLKKENGVKNVSVNFATRTAEITFEDKLINEKRLFNIVSKMGYTPIDTTLRNIEFKVVGMGSEHCAGVVKNAVEKLKGIDGIETNFANSSANIKYRPEVVKISDIKKAIDDAGYNAIIEE